MSPEYPVDKDRTIIEHVGELRNKFFISLGALIAGASIAHYFHEDIIRWVLLPAGEQHLVFLSPLDPLFFILKIDFTVGMILALPVIIWSIFSYIKPILSRKVARMLYVFYTASLMLLFVGFYYGYFVIVPVSLNFLFSIAIPGIENTITVNSYLGFVLTQTLIITIIFQIPILLITGFYTRLFAVRTLSSKRRYVYLITTVALAIITPTTDVFNLGIMLIPTILIFEVSLIIGRIIELFRSKKDSKVTTLPL